MLKSFREDIEQTGTHHRMSEGIYSLNLDNTYSGKGSIKGRTAWSLSLHDDIYITFLYKFIQKLIIYLNHVKHCWNSLADEGDEARNFASGEQAIFQGKRWTHAMYSIWKAKYNQE